MGLCSSCCGRRRKHKNNERSERTPLLSQVTDPAHIRAVSQTAVDVIAATKAGKYPSQEQVNRVVRALLKSDILKEHRYTKVSPPGRRIVADVRSICEQLLVFGLEKNDDDRMQELLHRLGQIKPPTEIATSVLEETIEVIEHPLPPTHEIEQDIYALAESTKSIAHLLVTSTAFRALLSTLAGIAQTAVSEVANDVSEAAGKLQDVADTVSHVAEAVEASAGELGAKAVGDVDTSISNIQNVPQEVTSAVKDVIDDVEIQTTHSAASTAPLAHGSGQRDQGSIRFAEALQAMLVDARQRPEHASAIKSIIHLFEKYAYTAGELLHSAVQGTQSASVSQASPFFAIIDDLRCLLERLASGKSAALLIDSFKEFFVSSDSKGASMMELKVLLAEILAFLDRALAVDGYIVSAAGKDDTLQLLDHAKVVNNSLRVENAAFRMFSSELHGFYAALRDDKTTSRLWASFTTLLSDFVEYSESIRPSTQRALHLSQTLWNDATTFVWTAVVSFSSAVLQMNLSSSRGVIVPIPRVEYTDPAVDVALDGRLMRVSLDTEEESCDALDTPTTSWFMPSSVNVRRWNDLHVDFGSPTLRSSSTTTVRSSNKVHIHVDGVLSGQHQKMVSFDDIHYYIRYKGLLGYEDEGVAGLDIDLAGGKDDIGEGALDVVLEFEAGTEDQATRLVVESVKVNLPASMGLRLELSQSKHWLLNSLIVNPVVLPLATWFVKRQVETMLEGLVRSGVERLGTFANAVGKEKDAGETYAGETYAGAVWRAISGMLPEQDETETTVESTVTLKGVQVRSGENGEQALAVGVGAQLLPDKAQPEGLSNVYERTVEGMREVEGEVVEEIRRGEERVEEVGVGVSVAQDELGSAPGRVEEEQEVLRREGGWRSSAFDVL